MVLEDVLSLNATLFSHFPTTFLLYLLILFPATLHLFCDHDFVCPDLYRVPRRLFIGFAVCHPTLNPRTSSSTLSDDVFYMLYWLTLLLAAVYLYHFVCRDILYSVPHNASWRWV